MIPYILLFIISLAILVKASDWFVESAEEIGLGLGISPFIIGVTIIAFGTSLPELAASIAAVLSGNSEIVLGNVVGSNITNILLVLGLTAIIAKSIDIDFKGIQVDMAFLVISACFFWYVISDRYLAVWEAVALLALLVAFLYKSFSSHKGDTSERTDIRPKSYFLLPASGILVYLGATYTIVAIEQISLGLGISKEVIALTAVALGTSLPEVVVSITAAKKGKSAIAVGNVLGSNIFNTLAVVSIPRFIGPILISADILAISTPIMMAATIIFLMMCWTGKIKAWMGWGLIVAYTVFIYLSAV